MKINIVCYSVLGLTLVASVFLLKSIAMALLLVNLLTLMIYGADKLAARKSWQRVPEITLLVFGLAGGWVGGIIAQQWFRHKTQKQPFRTWFMLSICMNIMFILGAGYWLYGRGML